MKNIHLGLQCGEGLLPLDCWLHSWFFCTTGRVEFGWFSKLICGVVGTQFPCWQISAPPDSDIPQKPDAYLGMDLCLNSCAMHMAATFARIKLF